MPRKIIEIHLVVFIAACSFNNAAAHNKLIHQNMAKEAMNIANDAWGSDWLPEEWKAEVNDGSWHEDYKPPDHHEDPIGDISRTNNHGYNPITGTTGGIFTDWGANPENTARLYAAGLWLEMLEAESRGDFAGGDEIGMYHYLGRCSHLLQDVSSFPHVHPQNITILEHPAFEGEVEEDFAAGIPHGDVPLLPTDPLESDATDKLDDFSRNRLLSKTFLSNDIESFIETVARMTYFRSTFWGEVIFRVDTWPWEEHDGVATDEYTTETTFGDGTRASAEINTLRTMFGEPNVRYVNSYTDDYFEIIDREGHSLFWATNFDDQWYPCSGDAIDGSKTVVVYPGDGPVDENARTTGRFMFKEPYYPVVPQNYPDGQRFDGGNLGYYMSLYSIRAASAYNAGLLRVGAGPRLGDFNRDGWTDAADVEILAQAWLADDPLVDVAPGADGDGAVDFADYAVLGEHWSPR